MLKERFSRHFFVVHTFVSEEARREYLTPPEKREPPEARPTELHAFELEEKVVNSRASEMDQFMSAYRASDEIMRQYPTESDKW